MLIRLWRATRLHFWPRAQDPRGGLWAHPGAYCRARLVLPPGPSEQGAAMETTPSLTAEGQTRSYCERRTVPPDLPPSCILHPLAVAAAGRLAAAAESSSGNGAQEGGKKEGGCAQGGECPGRHVCLFELRGALQASWERACMWANPGPLCVQAPAAMEADVPEKPSVSSQQGWGGGRPGETAQPELPAAAEERRPAQPRPASPPRHCWRQAAAGAKPKPKPQAPTPNQARHASHCKPALLCLLLPPARRCSCRGSTRWRRGRRSSTTPPPTTA